MMVEKQPLIIQVLENASDIADEIVLVLRNREQQLAYECVFRKSGITGEGQDMHRYNGEWEPFDGDIHWS